MSIQLLERISVHFLKHIRMVVLILSMMVPVAVTPTHAMPVSAPKAAAAWCWCTQYIANRFGLPYNYPDAKDWGGYLIRNGFRQVSDPQVGDIAVYSAERMQNGAGHVGVIQGVSSTSLTVRGANQIWGTFTEYNCTNVSQGPFTRRSWGEAYYRR